MGRRFLRSLRHRMGAAVSAQSPLVRTTTGPIRGREYRLSDGRVVDMYMGIPFAEPPVGKLRFKKPQPVTPWTDELNCVDFGPRCPQKDEFCAQFTSLVGKDEAHCLTLNVFSPRWLKDQDKKFPTMVWIHGGAFSMHHSSNYGSTTIARNLCVKDVVVASINYRLGPFGFFTTGDDLCKGNMGLWDQTLALQWIHDNIERFGGDPNNVTLFGQSAGGGSVDLLSLSPHSRDLFHKVIAMSGCGECDFAMRPKQIQAQIGIDFARHHGWTGADSDTEGLLRFMEAQPASRIEVGLQPIKPIPSAKTSGTLAFLPNFDGDFFPRPLDELRREGPRKPIITGTTAHEGLFFVAIGRLNMTVEGFQKFADKLIAKCDYGNDVDEVRREIFDFYLKDVNPKNKAKIYERFIEFMGDYAINAGTYQYARKMTQYGNEVYFYCFDYANPDGFGWLRFTMPFKGATHCSDVRYVLGKGIFSKFNPNQEDLDMIEIMTTYFSNFAKYGNPNGDPSLTDHKTPLWEPFDITQPFRHLSIQHPKPTMADEYFRKRMELWERVMARNRSRSLITSGEHHHIIKSRLS
ncbi:hypothetical protein Q1695_005717 [Nippostrongylus brasiliensis]|nr:hypothetical protein Q1695_005717 [Nippostrongylus brasiliensis]